MNFFEPITKFLPQAVDTYFAQDAKSVILENGSKFIDVNFNEAGYVKIADFLLDGLSDYYKTQENPRPSDPAGYAAYAGNLGSGERDGFDIGGTTIRWEIFKLQWCRGRQFRIDHISNEESAKVVTGKLVEEFHRLKVIPEVDACRFGTIADSASVSLGNLVTETVGSDITAANIYSKFLSAREWLVEHGVEESNLVWFMNPQCYTLVMNSSELTKFIRVDEIKMDGKDISFKVAKINDTPIIEVVSSRFFTEVMTTRNGYQASSTSKSINYMVCDKRCIVPVRKIEYTKMYDEEMTGLAGFYGVMMNYLLYHGVVIPRNKLVGCYVSVGSAGTALAKTNVLSVDIRPGDVTNGWKLNAYFTQPSGLRGTVVYALADDTANPFTVGASVTIDGSEVKAIAVDGQAVDAVNTKYFFALVDYRGICIATTPAEVTLIKKS